jgi:hypothetical protein
VFLNNQKYDKCVNEHARELFDMVVAPASKMAHHGEETEKH